METDNKSPRLISTSSNRIDEALWVQILKRLPVETLGQFRCVCRSWNSLISSPFFITLHHSFTSSTTPPRLKPYLLLEDCFTTYVLCRPQLEDTLAEHLRHDVHFPFKPLVDNHVLVDLHFYVVDIIHGLVCFSSAYSKASSFESTVLWNPAIRSYVALPRLTFPLDPERALAVNGVDNFSETAGLSCVALGFGYDTCKNDFKVVRVCTPNDRIQLHGSSISLTYGVYSTQEEGQWRVAVADNIKCGSIFGCGLGNGNTSCFVNGTIHWLVMTLREEEWPPVYSVLMFDCECEELRIMEPPQEIFNPPGRRRLPEKEILEHAGMLSALVSSCLENFRLIELWVMEEHGVATSWRKLYKIDLLYGLGLEPNSFHIYQPSFEELIPYGRNQWSKCRGTPDKFFQILSGHVYEESLFLMDDTKAQSYTKKEIVHI